MFIVDKEKLSALVNVITEISETDIYSRDVASIIRVKYERKLRLANVKVVAGETKVCFILHNRDFVIKVSLDDKDNCRKEYRNYCDAVNQGLEMFFPKTELLVDSEIFTVIAQQAIDFSVEHTPDKKYNKYYRISRTVKDDLIRKVTKDLINFDCRANIRTVNYRWIAMALSLYGKRRVRNFCSFVVNHGIDDLHDMNVGYLNDKPVILDFSGIRAIPRED